MPGKRRSHGKWLPDSNAAERAPNRSCTPRYSPLGFCASSCGTFRQLLSVRDDNEVLSGKIPFPFNALESERKCRGASFFDAAHIKKRFFSQLRDVKIQAGGLCACFGPSVSSEERRVREEGCQYV